MEIVGRSRNELFIWTVPSDLLDLGEKTLVNGSGGNTPQHA